MHELGFGIRLATYEVSPQELNSAVETLVRDTARRARLDEMGAAIRERDGLARGADIIERVGLEHRRGIGG
jgi:UDP:flavonoid glycosyltransferase YjiC (YdhE family)